MPKRPPKYPWNRVPICQRHYKPCAVENVSSRYPGWSVHMGKIWKISSSVTEISVTKTEISVTGPARLLIWTHRNFCKEKSGEARSRKPSQPGQPGSYEEALSTFPLKSSTYENDTPLIMTHIWRPNKRTNNKTMPLAIKATELHVVRVQWK